MEQHSTIKKIVFLTGTRADFGKLKSLIEILNRYPQFEVHLFATGMHLDKKYGYTVHEIEKCGYQNIYKYINHDKESMMDITLSRTIEGFANYIRLIQPDLIIVHGDRIEALAGATVGALNNILVAHIEGGELSGTVDELIRHAVSKLSHTHFVANAEAKQLLLQMGECDESVYIIGSPDMDVMLSESLPSLEEVKTYYEIPFEEYAISIFHPVTTEIESMDEYATSYVHAIHESALNYIVIYPNNDIGSDLILSKILKLKRDPHICLFPSMRFECFLVLLKNAKFIVGNSSTGIREAAYYGIPSVNVGTRQNGRSINENIINCGYNKKEILTAIIKTFSTIVEKQQLFGDGNSDKQFLTIVQSNLSGLHQNKNILQPTSATKSHKEKPAKTLVNTTTEWTEILSPKTKLLDLRLNEIWRYRDLLFLFVRRDFVSQYKQTILGPLWHLVQPILTTIMFLLVFNKIAGIKTGNLPALLFYICNLTIWNYFQTCFTGTAATFTSNAGIFGKVYFPRLIIPLSIVTSNLIKLVIQFCLIIAMLIYFISSKQYQLNIGLHLLALPVIILITAAMALGLGVIISSLTTKYKDLNVLIGFGVQLLMYVTPVAYPLAYLQNKSYQYLIK